MKYLVLIVVCIVSTLLPEALAGEIDLKVGTIQLPLGFSEKQTGTKDSRRGEISKEKSQFIITYDIGWMAGLHMHPKKKDECLWFKEQLIAGQKIYIGLEQNGADKKLTISVVQPDASDRTPWEYPANFWAIVTTEEEVTELILIATSYQPAKIKKPNQRVDPIVTTPVDKVEPQSTQGHP